ncbi:hypothetical protein KVH27_18505 [Streptomyces olivaceus]|uniref:hypothetical protein n=1 Tax=Streptomyces olivaceus TaxID=47716 RepID=UPI001CCECFF7|nr:hypothetical protein [Streptomyces olivaceus]MBZ6250363.1 hypothetical protein [Streptomyces olivaceus]
MNVDDIVTEKIAAARARIAAAKKRRDDLHTARQRGLAHRHAAKLRHQANRGDAATVAGSPQDPADDRGPARTPENDTTEESA